MNVFNDYAQYYNLLYKDKEYDKEVAYIHSTLLELNPGIENILNIGCGTGNHDVLLKQFGYKIKGIDMSETMISLANQHTERGILEFEVSDAGSYRDGNFYDAVISLFHVVNYQCTNEELLAFFLTAAAHLHPGGVFIFDSWYGPALLHDKPYEKIREMEDKEMRIVRKTTPLMDYNKNIAHINFDVQIVEKKTGLTSNLSERHSMRYLFFPEIEFLALNTGFEIVKFKKWMSEEVPGEESWYVLYALVKKGLT